jgi:hypothetical protein
VKHLKHFITGSPKNYTVPAPRHYDVAFDQLTIMGYDHAVTLWLEGGRVGPKPERRVTKS